MDAILGRDDLMIEKIMKVIHAFDLNFIALIGTPVPAVIGTDYRGLKRLLEKKTHLPVLAIDTNGMSLYDEGVMKAYQELVKLPQTACETQPHKLGLLGYTPLDFSASQLEAIKAYYQAQGYDVVALAQDDVTPFLELTSFAKMVVVSPAAVKAARYLERHYHIPYEMLSYPLIPLAPSDEPTLIIHQQAVANALRQGQEHVVVGSYFMMNQKQKQEGDVHFEEEDDVTAYIKTHHVTRVIADESFAPLIGEAKLIPLHHTAVSGEAYG